MTRLAHVSEIKQRAAGESVTLRARVLRCWDVGGARMALVGDESALTRIELGYQVCEIEKSYEFRDLVVREYPGGWHSASVVDKSQIVPAPDPVHVSQDEAYIERTFKILAGVQRKKARRAGRVEAWTHPAHPRMEKTDD